MAQHRSPSGAVRPELRPGTPPGVAASASRDGLPALPQPTARHRVTVVAAAGGALVAAGQTVAGLLGVPGLSGEKTVEDPAYSRLAASSMLPVNDVRAAGPGDAASRAASSAIGGEQLSHTPASSVPDLEKTSKVDVASLTKATKMSSRAAVAEKAVSSATAQGAPKAVQFKGETLVMPTAGRFTSGFGSRWGVQHKGIDLAAPIGTPIFALTDGVVEKSGPASGFGMWVVLEHPDGTHTVYGHINRSLVEAGQKVKAGQQIAEVGNRGQSTGPHLHLEVWEPDGTKIDPLPWLSTRGLDVTHLTGGGSAL
ncbi:M23 family metallopeptidase [Pseudonocardia phyllosphaerae]|uniref:M23 family metallopeptidase n=1 Tax=Pseudonocardia phyllosphaerae TaxID=3390502 RepID=UPI00397BB1B8